MEVEINEYKMEEFAEKLRANEKAPATISKYMRDIKTLCVFCESRKKDCITKELLVEYKSWLQESYKANSINSMIAAVNQYLKCNGALERLKPLKIQKNPYLIHENRLNWEEYGKLIGEMRKHQDQRMELMVETLGTTGIRIGELKYFRVESVKKKRIDVQNKGKIRRVYVSDALTEKLLSYAKECGKKGNDLIFSTRSGKPWDRSNIWRNLKKYAEMADLDEEKVYPHNFRHLFATTHYRQYKDLLMLGTLLGHSNIETTRIYAAIDDEECKNSVNNLEIWNDKK